jgi:YesN/AraC family two-component response regulator
MYKVVLVEDEEIFRKVLPEIIDWKALGFEIVKIVENGRKALEYLQEEQVDVILTDIRMPVLNGLDLAMEVKNRYPMTKIILLSAFNEFDYARKGIDCGVYGYILKSEGEEEIERYFRNLKKTLDSEFFYENRDMWGKRELFAQYIIKDKAVPAGKVQDIAKKARLPVTYENCTVSIFELDERRYLDYLYDTEYIAQLIFHTRNFLISRIELKQMGYVLILNSTVYVIWNIEKQKALKRLGAIFADLCSEIQLYDNGEEPQISITCAVGMPGSDIAGLQYSYRKAKQALLHRVYIGGGHIIDCEKITLSIGNCLSLPDEEQAAAKILSLIHEGNTTKTADYLEFILNSFVDCKLTDMSVAIAFVTKVVLTVMNEVRKMRVSLDDEVILKSTCLIKAVGFCDTIGCALRQLELFLTEVMVLLFDNFAHNSRIIEEALQYIRSNYPKQILLEDVASHVNLHPVYLSRLFKSEIRKTFKSVLTEIRIEKAKKLLVSNLDNKVYEISELVGYEKPRYFSSLFKNMTGLTPLEYREKYKI